MEWAAFFLLWESCFFFGGWGSSDAQEVVGRNASSKSQLLRSFLHLKRSEDVVLLGSYSVGEYLGLLELNLVMPGEPWGTWKQT